MAQWPDKSVNFLGVIDGIECTMSTEYNGVTLTVRVTREKTREAEREAKRLLEEKVKQRKRLER